MTLRLDALGNRVLVNGPMRLSQRDAIGFITANSDWIEQRFSAAPLSAPCAEGAQILVRGRPTLLLRRDGRGAPMFTDGPKPSLTICASQARFSAAVIAALKAFALDDAMAYHDRLSQKLGRKASKLSLRDARTRWGSCTSNGDIMLSWRLIGAPPRVFEYVVAHELAHLLEMNHSPRFWAHVEDLMPDWRLARAWLKKNGATLHALGR
jgi:predicted metal-dependent hydrolase